MLNIKYRATYTFTDRDIGDISDNEPIIYEVWANRKDGWSDTQDRLIKSNFEDIETALDMIGLAVVSISQNGERFPLKGRAGAEDLHRTIEDQNPGCGDEFVCRLAIGICSQQVQYERQRLGNLDKPLPVSANGNGKKKSRAKTAEST